MECEADHPISFRDKNTQSFTSNTPLYLHGTDLTLLLHKASVGVVVLISRDAKKPLQSILRH
jgi:hypothetical protein